MTDSNTDYSDLMAVLRGMLGQTLTDQATSPDPPSSEELFDLVEGRLTATEREDLLERIAVHPDAQAELADLLVGIDLTESSTAERAVDVPAAGSVWETLRSWVSPRVLVPAMSLCILAVLTVPYFMGPPSQFGVQGPGELQGTETTPRSLDGNMFAPDPTAENNYPEAIPSATAEVQPATGEIRGLTDETEDLDVDPE